MNGDEKLVGVIIDPTPLKAKVPRAIELNKLIVDDFRGDGGKAEILDVRKSEDYVPPEPFHAPTLGDALEHFRPTPVVEVPSLENPGEKKKYRVEHTDIVHFEPGSYERRIPELRQLEESFQGLCRFQDWLNTKDGEDHFEDVAANEKLAEELGDIQGRFEAYLKRIEKVLDAEG